MQMRVVGLAGVMALGAGVAGAQGTQYQAEGSLEATQDPGCIGVEAAVVTLTPADLALGVLACGAVGDFDRAVGLYILMQLRARYDTLRVADETAHQGETVLAQETFAQLGGAAQDGLKAAFGRFGDVGSLRHTRFCDVAKAGCPPDYVPVYMIQHGITAFTGRDGDGLVPGFDAGAAWPGLLQSYMQCQPG